MPPNKKVCGGEIQLTGTIIAKLIATGNLDEICAPYKVKVSHKANNDKGDGDHKAKKLKGETEYVLYLPFGGNVTLAKRYLEASTGLVELLDLLANAGRDDKLNLQAISFLLFIVERCKPEEPDGQEPLGHSILPVLKRRLKELSKGNPVVVKHTLRLVLACAEESKIGALREFVEGGDLYRFMLTVNNPGPKEYQLALLYFYHRFGDDAEVAGKETCDEFADKEDLEHNGEIVNTLLLMLALRGIDVFASRNLAHLVHQNFKHENVYGKIFTLKALLAVANNKLYETEGDLANENEQAFFVSLLTNVNNNLVKIVNADDTEPEKQTTDCRRLYNRLVCELLAVAEKFRADLGPAFVKKYNVGTIQRFIYQLWRATPKAYEAYVESLEDTFLTKKEGAEQDGEGRGREDTTHLRVTAGPLLRALIVVLTDYLTRMNKLPKFADKNLFNAVLKLKNIAVSNKVLALFVAMVETGSAGTLLDLNTLINLSPTAYLSKSNAPNNQTEALEYTHTWLVLMRKFAKRTNAVGKIMYDFYKLFGLELVSDCYKTATRAYVQGTWLKKEHDEMLEVDVALARCVFYAGVNGTIKGADRYLLPLLLRLAGVNGFLREHGELTPNKPDANMPEAERYKNKLTKYVNAIFEGVGCKPTPSLTENVRDNATAVVALVVYRVVLKHNTSILFNFALPTAGGDEHEAGAEHVCVTCAGHNEPDVLHALLRNLHSQAHLFQDRETGAKFLECKQCGGRYLNLARAANAEAEATLASAEAATLLPLHDADATTVREAFPNALTKFLESFFGKRNNATKPTTTDPEPTTDTRRKPTPAQLKGLLDNFVARINIKQTVTKLNLLLSDAAILPHLTNAKSFELVAAAWGNLGECEGPCDPLSCEKVLLYNALNLAARYLEKAATPALCEKLLADAGFIKATRMSLAYKYHFVGFCLETATKLAAARLMKLLLEGLGETVSPEMRKTLRGYFTLISASYNCTRADEDQLLRNCIFKLTKLFADSPDDADSHFKLPVTLRSLYLVAVNMPHFDGRPPLTTHGYYRKWGVYDKCFIFKRWKYPPRLLPDRNVIDEARLRASECEDRPLTLAEVKQLADRFGITETRSLDLNVGDTRYFFDALGKWAAAGRPRKLPQTTLAFLDSAFTYFTAQPPTQVDLNLLAYAYDLEYLAAHVNRVMALAYYNAQNAKRFLFHGDAPNERGLDQIYRVIWLCRDKNAVSAEKLTELCSLFTALDEGKPPHENLLEKIVHGGKHTRILPQTNYILEKTLECFRTLNG